MATAFQKPENALKRAEQLISVGQQAEALNVLHSTISHRRLRLHGWDSNAELIMMKYVRLCVDLEKLKFVREGLHFYRTLTQQHNVLSLAKVMKELRDLSEAKLEAVKARASDEAALSPGVDDLEADESPESLILSTLQVEVRDKTAKELHTALFGCWESYKIIMDLLRFAPKIDYLYHETSHRALEFCRDNKRHQEFRRLCDTLRLHYLNFQKYRGRPDFDPLLRPENHLKTRLVQMDVAADLCLWSQCFQTAEDILALGLHELVQRTLTTKDPVLHKSRGLLLSQTAMFYEKLAQIFQVSDQPLFHASAVLRNLFHTRQHKKIVSKNEQVRLCDIGTLAVLCVPILQKSTQSAAELEYQKKLSSMLGHGGIPTRASMQAVIETRGIVAAASPEVQQIYSLLEGEVNPMSFCTDAEKLIAELETKPSLSSYVLPIKRVVFNKLILKLSRIYTSMSINFFTASVCPESFLPWREAEALVVQLVHQGFVQLRLDYSQKLMFFGDAIASADSILKNRLVSVAKVLSDIVQQLPGKPCTGKAAIAREQFYCNFPAKLAAEAQRLQQRNKAVADRRLKQEQEQQAREEARKTKEKEKQKKEELEEQIRRETALKHQENLRRREEQQQMKLDLSQQIVAEFKTIAEKASGKIMIKGKAIEEITAEDIAKHEFDYEDYEKAQEELRNRERQERSRQHRHESKRAEHLVRALREEEALLLAQWQDATRVQDEQLIEEMQIQLEEEKQKQFIESQRQREIFISVKPMKQQWVQDHIGKREDVWKEQCKARLERVKQVLRERKIERARLRCVEAGKRLQEEEAQRQREADERQKREEEDARRRAAEMQRLKDLEIEVREREQRTLPVVLPAIVTSSQSVQPEVTSNEPDWAMLRSRPVPVATRQTNSSHISSAQTRSTVDDIQFRRKDTKEVSIPVAAPTPVTQSTKYIPPQRRQQQGATSTSITNMTNSTPKPIDIRRPDTMQTITHNKMDNLTVSNSTNGSSTTWGSKPSRQAGAFSSSNRQAEDIDIVRSKPVLETRPIENNRTDACINDVIAPEIISNVKAMSDGASYGTVSDFPSIATMTSIVSGSNDADGFTTVTKKQKARGAK